MSPVNVFSGYYKVLLQWLSWILMDLIFKMLFFRWRIMEINGYVRAFIRRLIRLVNLKIKRETIVNEQYYTDMQTTFGGMCSLMVE